MFVKNIGACPEFTANDGCRIREVLHPAKEPVDLPYSIAHARVAPAHHSYRHKLKQAEVYYLLTGRGRMHIDDRAEDVSEGDVIYIPPHAVQWIENMGQGDLEFLALVSPPWTKADDIRLE